MTTRRQGSSSLALAAVRQALAPVLAEVEWELLEADSRFSAWNILAAPGNGGIGIILTDGESVQQQAQRSLVTNLSVVVVLAGRKHLLDPAAARIAARSNGAGLEDVADRVKGAMLSMSLPANTIPNPACAVPNYAGRTELVTPDGIPLDGCELRFSLMLAERFSPENVDKE